MFLECQILFEINNTLFIDFRSYIFLDLDVCDLCSRKYINFQHDKLIDNVFKKSLEK